MTARELYKECEKAGTLDFALVVKITELHDKPVKIDVVIDSTYDVNYSNHEVVLIGDAYDLVED